MATDPISQLKSLQARIDKLERYQTPGYQELIDNASGFCDEFWGDVIDARWNLPAPTGSAAAPALQASSPSRLLFVTGATINSVSTLNEAAVYKWSASDTFTLVTRVKISSLISIAANLCRVAVTGANLITLGFTSTVSATNFFLRSTSGGVSTTTVMPDAADTGWHTLAISVSSTFVRGRVDRGAYTEITSNIPTIDLGISLDLQNLVAADRQLELDRVIMKPGVNWF